MKKICIELTELECVRVISLIEAQIHSYEKTIRSTSNRELRELSIHYLNTHNMLLSKFNKELDND